MNAQLNGMMLQAKIARRSRGWFVAIAAALVAAGVASALLLTRSGAPSVPVPMRAVVTLSVTVIESAPPTPVLPPVAPELVAVVVT